MSRLYCALAIALALASPPVQADVLSARIEAFLEQNRAPGLVLMIVQDGQVLRHQAYGWADRERHQPLQRDAIFRFYSMTKPITAVALLSLVEDGKLSLETPVHHVLPRFPAEPAVTMQHLLTHTAGYAYGGSFSSWAGLRYLLANPMDQEGKTLTASMDVLASLPLLHAPGAAWTYGMASDVQGAVIERISGQPLEEYLRTRIFGPLGMEDTGFHVDPARMARLAPQHSIVAIPMLPKYIYRDIAQDRAFLQPPKLVSGGGGLVGTVADYMRFVRWLFESEAHQGVLAPELRRRMMRNQLPTAVGRLPERVYANSGYGYGLGVKLTDEQYLSAGSVFWAGKGGSLFWLDPARRLAVVAAMPLTGAARGLEKRLVPWVYEWLGGRATEETR